MTVEITLRSLACRVELQVTHRQQGFLHLMIRLSSLMMKQQAQRLVLVHQEALQLPR